MPREEKKKKGTVNKAEDVSQARNAKIKKKNSEPNKVEVTKVKDSKNRKK